MKKITKFSVLALCVAAIVITQSANAQGDIDYNNYDASAGVFLLTSNTPAPVTSGITGTYIVILGGASSGSLTPIVSINSGSGTNQLTDFNGDGPGSGSFLDQGDGPVSGVAGNGTGFFQFIAWTGSASLSSATDVFESAIWSEAVGTAAGVSPPTPGSPTTLNISTLTPVDGLVENLGGGNFALIMTSVTPVPEPATLALASLGGLSLLALRRRKA